MWRTPLIINQWRSFSPPFRRNLISIQPSLGRSSKFIDPLASRSSPYCWVKKPLCDRGASLNKGAFICKEIRISSLWSLIHHFGHFSSDCSGSSCSSWRLYIEGGGECLSSHILLSARKPAWRRSFGFTVFLLDFLNIIKLDFSGIIGISILRVM